MDSPLVLFGAMFFLIVVVVGFGVLVMASRFYRKVDQGRALIINKTGTEPVVSFTGGFVLPVIHRGEQMEISVKTIEIARSGKEGLICADNIRADIKVTFFVRVNKTVGDVLKVAQAVGCERASDPSTLEELFVAKFSEALKTVGKQLEFEQLYTKREEFRDSIVECIGHDLNGFVLEDCAIDYLEQTPIETLDKDNILDAHGIRKITSITSVQNVATNDLRNTERKELERQNVEADRAIFELEKQRAKAEEEQKREIASIRAREQAETESVQAEERRRAELTRIKAEEEIEVGNLSKQRRVEIADKDRERDVAVKTEQVLKEQALEEIARERAVEQERIDKEKAIEVKKKEIADVIRTRVAVEKTVAEEEERIKDVRAVSEANRNKDVKIITAEAAAEEALVLQIKEAEANEKRAEYEAREKLVRANASLEAADKDAKAKIRLAEGSQAEEAASGLAHVKVKEAEAVAVEKMGLAEARVTKEKMVAEAEGSELKGLAEVKVKSAEVDVLQRVGNTEALVAREKAQADADGQKAKYLAEAAGMEERGMAKVRVLEAEAGAIEKKGHAEATAIKDRLLAEAAGKEADASAIEKMGLAEAAGVQAKLQAEAAGLAEKAEAMKRLEGIGREHEEFRLELEKDKEVALASLEARREIAESQAKVLAEAFGSTDVKIVGGDGEFFERFVKAASMGNALDGFMEHSDAAQAVVGKLVNGGGLGRILEGASGATADVAGVLGKLASEAEGPVKEKLGELIDRAKELGVDDHSAH